MNDQADQTADARTQYRFVDPSVVPYRRSLMNELVAPRPVAWVSSIDAEGRTNLAPFSHFNVVSSAPPIVMFSCNTPTDRALKDTVSNVIATGEFVVNLASYPQREAMVATSEPVAHGVDEFDLAGLSKLPSIRVAAPRVAGAPAAMECRLERVVRLEGRAPGESDSQVVFGRVVGMHLREDLVDSQGRFDSVAALALGRLGGVRYVTTTGNFALPAPFKARD